MSLDPLWTWLNRYLCTCQPIMELQQKAIPASKSLLLEYTALPPAFAIGRALRSKHLLLALVCSTTLSTNVLAVAFSTLFNADFRNLTGSLSLMRQYEPRLRESPYIDSVAWALQTGRAYYLAKSYLMDNGTLPPWVCPKYFFAPFEVDVSRAVDTISYRAETIGFEPYLDCEVP